MRLTSLPAERIIKNSICHRCFCNINDSYHRKQYPKRRDGFGRNIVLP
jgi:hypothetical protein